jgi:hypothetical protein
VSAERPSHARAATAMPATTALRRAGSVRAAALTAGNTPRNPGPFG